MDGEGRAASSPAITADDVTSPISPPASPVDGVASPTSSADGVTSLMSPDSSISNGPSSLPHGPISPPPESSGVADDLRAKIIKQVEYYFSDENLPTDNYLLHFMKKDREGFVPIGVIASFRKMKKLAQDISLIVEALKGSSQLVVSSDGKKVKRLCSLVVSSDGKKACTVLVENLPADHSTENIQRIFGEVGNIRKISIRDPHAAEDSKRGGKVEMLISNKVHAFVEYDSVEAAEKAVAILNNEKDWRNGMRVKLLNQLGKYCVKKKSRKDHDSDRNTSARAPDPARNEEDHNLGRDETPDKGDVEQHSKEKNGQGGKRWGKKSRQKYHGNNGHGHGTTSSSLGVEASKPPPGPRMPDGTRGFAMGRGRPLVSN